MAPNAAGSSKPKTGLILSTVVVSQLVVTLDATVVNIALPSAQSDLGFSTANRQWIITAYAMAFGGLLLLGGRLSDLMGRRRALLIALVGFAAASALGGASPNFVSLTVARAAQGAFAALLAPTALALLVATFTEQKARARAFAAFSAAASGGAAVGVLLGGVLTQTLSWRWTLYINIALCALAVVSALSSLRPGAHRTSRRRLDAVGATLVTAGLFALVFGLSTAESDGWSSSVCWGSLIAAGVLIAAFIAAQQLSSDPLLPLSLLANRYRSGVLLVLALLSVGMFGALLFVNYYVQQILGFTPVMAGVAFLPMVGLLILGAQAASHRLLPRFGARPVIALCMTSSAGGMACLALLAHSGGYASAVLPALCLLGAGIGVTITSCFQTATRGVEPQLVGVASATANTSQQIGGAIGTALLNTIAIGATTRFARSHSPGPGLTINAATHGYIVVYWWGTGAFLLAVVIATALLRNRPPHPSSANETAPIPATSRS